MFLNLFKSPSFLSLYFNPLLKTSPYGEYLNLYCSITPSLYPKSPPVKYSYLSSSLDDNSKSLTASRTKSNWP